MLLVRVFLIVGLAIGGVSLAEGDEPPGRRWRDGPVRYLLTDEEYRRYGQLDTDEARAMFVSRFWRRHDPDPRTARNEFRERFEERCEAANHRFAGGLSAGWKRDRGLVLVLLGEPDAIRAEAGDPRSISREVWAYDHPAGGSGVPLEIVFYRGQDGVYRLDPREAEDDRGAFARDETLVEERRRLMIELRRNLPGFNRSQLGSIVEGLLQSSPRPWLIPDDPPEERVGPGSVTTTDSRSFQGARIVEDEVYFFQADDGSVVALVVLAFRPAADGSPGTFAAAARAEEVPHETARVSGGTVELVHREQLSRDGLLVFTGRLYLEPGVTYDVRYAVGNNAESTLSMRHKRIAVPQLATGTISVSSVVPAESFGPLRADGRSPFAMGSEEIVPRPSATYHRGEPLRLYLQVYGARGSGGAGAPRVDVKFRFERATRRGFRRHGKPLSFRGSRGASIGLALPVGDWPEGEYRVMVEIHDREARSKAYGEQAFRIVE